MADRWLFNWQALGGPEPEPEYLFNKPLSRHRFDFAWPDIMVAVEIEGGIFKSKGKGVGAHVRGVGYTEDCKKYNRAVILGWQLFRFTTLMVDDLTQYDPVLEFIFKQYEKEN